jgi:hypothetical protein
LNLSAFSAIFGAIPIGAEIHLTAASAAAAIASLRLNAGYGYPLQPQTARSAGPKSWPLAC